MVNYQQMKEIVKRRKVDLMNKKVNAKRIASAKFRKAKNKEIALANNLFLAFPAGIEPTVYRLGGDCVIRLRYGKIFTF